MLWIFFLLMHFFQCFNCQIRPFPLQGPPLVYAPHPMPIPHPFQNVQQNLLSLPHTNFPSPNGNNQQSNNKSGRFFKKLQFRYLVFSQFLAHRCSKDDDCPGGHVCEEDGGCKANLGYMCKEDLECAFKDTVCCKKVPTVCTSQKNCFHSCQGRVVFEEHDWPGLSTSATKSMI